MNNFLLLLSPIINVFVTALFAGMVIRQYVARKRTYQLYWSIALAMAFLATLAYTLMIIVGPTSEAGILLFRLYYIQGAALMPAWLGLGSIALVSRPAITRICLGILSLLSLIAISFISDATINLQMLSQIAGTPGTGTLRPGPWLVMTIILNTLGVIAVVGVAIYSGWQMMRRQKSSTAQSAFASNLLRANVLILVGDLLNGAAGTLARVLGLQSTFWIIMALGWAIFFWGVMLASKRVRVSQPSEKSEKTEYKLAK